jgi:hypothetical protein
MAYLSQRNNDFNPDGACNVTSIAMCLKYLGINRKTSVGQFEDELYDYCESKGLSRHDPYDLQRLAEAYGAQDEFRESATLNQIKSHLAIGNPVVIHGYFTDFGHIVAVNGYNDDGLYVHDPYGEWFLSGYKLNNPYGGEGGPGENIFYSNELITQTCDHDGIWAHFLAK